MPRVTFEKGDKLARIEGRLDKPGATLKQIGVLLVSVSQRSFKDQRLGAKEWKPRSPVNVFGIIADFAAGRRKPPQRRFEQRPALRDTGALAKSIAFQVSGDVVEVGTNIEYARVHQFGGKVESAPLTDSVRDLLKAWLKTQALPIKRRLGWLLNRKFRGKTIAGEVPARPFLGVTPEARKAVRKLIGVELLEVT